MFENVYGLDAEVRSLAVANEFVSTMNKVCYALGEQLQPFDFFRDGVVDFSTFEGLAGQSSLLDEIRAFREESAGYKMPNDKWMLFSYLLSVSVCYVEVPKWVTKMGVRTATYDKFLCTRNPKLMGAWMGMPANEMQAKYSPRIKMGFNDHELHQLKLVKLNQSNKGNSITVPRSAVNCEEIHCMPLFMLNAMVHGFRDKLNNSILRFTFLKDNGTERVLDTTLSNDILMKYYNDTMFVSTMLSGVDIDGNNLGGIHLSSRISRGFIRVPELGSSIYDETGVRALNLARITKIEEISEIDDRYIHVDLNSVQNNFNECIEWMVTKMPEALPVIYKDITEKDAELKTAPVLVTELEEYVSNRIIIMSTEYKRFLHNYMVDHPNYFVYYTGKPNKVTESSTNFGVGVMDF